MPYRLFFGDVELGNVTQEDQDFPSLFGRFYPNTRTDHPELRAFLARYRDYSVAADRLMTEETEAEWERFVAENEEQFLDLIETDRWSLLAEDGTREPILIPIFGQDGGLMWRWNVTGDESAPASP